MKRFSISLLLSGCLWLQMQAQDPHWNWGSLVLQDRSVLQGELVVQQGFDIVLFRGATGVLVYPAHRVSAVYYHDTRQKVNRKFRSLSDGTTHKRHALFEIVYYGDVLVLRRIVSAAADPEDHANSYHYFVKYDDKLVSFKNFGSMVFGDLAQKCPSLSELVKEMRLSPNSREDIIAIVRLYTKLNSIYTEALSSM